MSKKRIRLYLVQGIAAAKAGDITEARFNLERLLTLGGTAEDEEKAKLWLSRIETDPEKKREYLEQILVLNPTHPEARRDWAMLQGELKPEEIVNADRLEQEKAPDPLCPRCGTRLEEGANGENGLHCPLCGWYASLASDGLPEGDVEVWFQQGVAAARSGDRNRARQAFARILNANPDRVPKTLLIHTWLWLSGLTEKPEERRRCLEAVLRLDPEHALARRGLELLEATRETAEPEIEAEEATAGQEQAQGSILAQLKARRIVCPQCGGSMTAYGLKARCDYCGYQSPILEALSEGSVAEEQDFVVALATAKGHRIPTGMGVLRCQACGAQYLLMAHQMALKCAYCGSPHVVEAGQMALIPPHGVVPMEVTPEQAELMVREWLQAHALHESLYVQSLSGAFLPLWTFDVGGELVWKCTVVRRENRYATIRYDLSGEYPLLEDDILVPASHTLPRAFQAVFKTFDTNASKPFVPELVAGWPVEVYSVSVSDASIAARSSVWKRRSSDIRRLIEKQAAGGAITNLNISSMRMGINSYKLVLVPLWIARFQPTQTADPDLRVTHLVIQGQTGEVFAPPEFQQNDEPGWGDILRDIGSWWRSLLDRS